MTISSIFQRLRRPPIAAALAITIAATTAAGAVQAQTTDASANQNTVAEKAVLTDLISGIVSAIKGAAPTANALIGSPSASSLTVSPSVSIALSTRAPLTNVPLMLRLSRISVPLGD